MWSFNCTMAHKSTHLAAELEKAKLDFSTLGSPGDVGHRLPKCAEDGDRVHEGAHDEGARPHGLLQKLLAVGCSCSRPAR